MFIKGRKVHVYHYPKYKKEVFKAEEESSGKGTKHLRVCPNCGHTEFTVVPSGWSWLLGQKSQCSKCKFVFKKAFTEVEYQKGRRFSRDRRG